MKTAPITIKISKPRDFGVLFWVSLGYIPTDRLCLIAVAKSSHQPLGAMASAELCSSDQDWSELIAQLVASSPGADLVVCGFVDSDHRSLFARALQDVVAAAGSCGSRILAAMEVSDAQWAPVRTAPLAACGGRAALPEPVTQWRETEIYQELVRTYGTPALSEADLRARVIHPRKEYEPESEFLVSVAAHQRALEIPEERREVLHAAWRGWERLIEGGSIEAAVVAGLREPTFRDAMLLAGVNEDSVRGSDVVDGRYDASVAAMLRGMFTPGGPTPDQWAAERAIRACARIAPHTSGRDRCYTLAIQGLLYWWTGHGVKARIASEAARDAVGAHESVVLLECLEEVTGRRLPPGWALA